jgi:hypothetical protein
MSHPGPPSSNGNHLIPFDKAEAPFSFLYLKKIKISKIFVGFEKFQKYTPVARPGPSNG